jgi:antitoxin (DNA-binding transcriptional repressor) of toxin-antitoxin stability system
VKRISVHEVKAHFAAVIKDIEAGETVIVTRHDKPVVEMRSVVGLPTPRLGAFADPAAPHLEVSWSHEELDELFGEFDNSKQAQK